MNLAFAYWKKLSMTEWQVPYICITKPTNTHSSISTHLPFQYYVNLHLLETFTPEHNPLFFYINFSYPMAHYLGIQIHLHHTSLKKPAIIQFLYSLFTWKLAERVVSSFSTSMLFLSYCNQFSSTSSSMLPKFSISPCPIICLHHTIPLRVLQLNILFLMILLLLLLFL